MIEELLDQTQERRLDIIVTAILLPLVLTLAIPQVIPDWVRVVAGGLLVLAVLFLLLVGVLGRRARGYIGQNVAFTLPRQALLFTVGRQVSTIEFALANQRPAYVALLCTKDSQADAEAILAKQHLSDRKSVV